jgi:hypothetical protein
VPAAGRRCPDCRPCAASGGAGRLSAGAGNAGGQAVRGAQVEIKEPKFYEAKPPRVIGDES